MPGCSRHGVPHWCDADTCSMASLSCSYTGHDCCWPPEQLDLLMLQQELAHRRYNELVFDPELWVRRLPFTIEAFFVLPGSSPEDLSHARAEHASFLKEYHISAVEVPLLVFHNWPRVKGAYKPVTPFQTM